MSMDDKIKQKVIELFKPELERIERQSNCNHIWKDKDGSAHFRCKNCGFLAEDRELDKMIMEMKLLKKGITPVMIKKFKKYI